MRDRGINYQNRKLEEQGNNSHKNNNLPFLHVPKLPSHSAALLEFVWRKTLLSVMWHQQSMDFSIGDARFLFIYHNHTVLYKLYLSVRGG